MSEYIVVHGIRIAKDFVPETFGRLTTIGPRFMLPVGSQERRRNLSAHQVCLCACGSGYLVVRVCSFRTGNTKSCGCLGKENRSLYALQIKHGMHKSAEYKAWADMTQRCNNPKHSSYYNYGERGISVYSDWLVPEIGFQNFYDYMGPRPSPKHSIDRYPNRDGNYEPGNVRWATRTEQNRNTSRNHFVTYNGKTQCVAAWAEETGIKVGALYSRLKRGWAIGKALTTPVQGQK